jgi:ankyrin repeat protein
MFGGSLDEDLAAAARDGDTPRVKKMLAYGAHVHAWDDVALRWAAGNGHSVAVAILIGAGANIHAKDNEALRVAELNGHPQTAKLIRDAIEKLDPRLSGTNSLNRSPSP